MKLPVAVALFALLLGSARAEDVLGYTEPYKIITVSAGDTGVIANVFVEEGAVVKKGDILAQLDTASLEAELDIAKAEAHLQATRKQRLDDLASTSRATPEELEKAEADLSIKNAEVRKYQALIETRLMRSAVDGVVTEVKRHPGEAVSPSNPHVLTVVQIDKLTANLYLPPEKAFRLQAGSAAPLLLNDHDKVLARVEFISPITDAATGTVRVKFMIDNADQSHRSGAKCALAE